jgi:hypothetical protein
MKKLLKNKNILFLSTLADEETPEEQKDSDLKHSCR